tara:strand:+ start:207 stop:452 length:246 start_codon:yes stop_codon:yes gene_type:complete
MSDAAYVVFISLKEEGTVNDHPLAPLSTEMEAIAYRNGYIDAIVNHTDQADRTEVSGLFGIKRVGEEFKNKNKKGDDNASD